MDVRIEDVCVNRGGRDLISIRSLHIQAGRTTAVLGPNGAGKTTLLRLIAGLDQPDTGRVLVGGVTADPRRRCVGYVFQEDVFLRRTLLENLTLPLTIRGVPRAEAHTRATTALELLGIAPLAGRRADRISGGEARRASLARALSLRTPVLLLDEPLAGLDGSTYARLLDELPLLIGNLGATTLVVTHVREEAFRLCDAVVIIVDGQTLAVGSKQDIATNPQLRQVAEVLGYTVLDVGGQSVAIPDGALQLGSGSPMLTGIVESIVDVVRHWDVTVIVQGVRVHVRIPRNDTAHRIGDRLSLHAEVMYEVS